MDSPVVDPDRQAARRRRADRLRSASPLLVPMVLIVVALGPHLIGVRSLSPADQLYNWQPWASEAPEGLTPTHDAPFSDNFDGVLPAREELVDRIRSGDWPVWTPSAGGGTDLATNIGTGAAAPSNGIALVTPGWYTTAVLKALELLAAWGFVFLFLRRVGAGRWPSAFAGAVFAMSGFQVVWVNWPHTRVAALVAGMLWAFDRLIERVEPERVALAAVVVAAAVLEGFPAVAAVGVGAVALVLSVRLVQLSADWRSALMRIGAAIAAALLGAGMTAVVTLPFASSLRDYGLDRGVPPDAPIARALGTLFAPNALGPAESYAGPLNYIEVVGYLGAPAFLLVVVGVAVLLSDGRPNRQGVLLGVTAVGGATMLLYSYGVEPLYDLFRGLPLLATNPAMRVKSSALLLLAIASGLALDAVVRWPLSVRARWISGAAVLGAFGFIALYLVGFAQLASPELSDYVTGEVIRAIVVAALAVVFILILLLRTQWPSAAPVAVVGLITISVVDALVWVVPYWPRSDPDTLYPVTEAHEFLDENLGRQRFGALGLTFFPGTSTYYGQRAVHGHLFHDPAWVDLLESAGATMRSPTFSSFEDPASASSPVLDRLGTALWADPAGIARCAPAPMAADPADEPADDPLPRQISAVGPGVRGVTVTPASPIPGGTVLRASASGPGGRQLVDEVRVSSEVPAGRPVTIAVADLERVAGQIDIAVGSSVPLELESAPAACMAPDDGLSLVHTSGAWIYERENALDRIRWAGSARVTPDEERRLEALASGELDDDVVILNDGASSDLDSPGEVLDVRDDGGDTMWITVDAGGPGHVVVADAIQDGWEATVDGEPATIVPADHAGGAVAVDEGVHEVVLRAEPPGATAGLVVTGASTTVAVGLFALGAVRQRRAPAGARAGSARPARRR